MENGIVTNTALYNCLHILRHKYLQDPSLAGFGSFGVDELYLKLKRYRANLIVPPITTITTGTSTGATTTISDKNGRYIGKDPGSGLESSPRYYVVALDLEKCYDNVDTSLLYDLVQNLLCSGSGDDSGTGSESGSGGGRNAYGNSNSSNSAGKGRDTERGRESEKEREQVKMAGKEMEKNEDGDVSESEDDDKDEDEGYMVHRYSVSHYISRLA